jgi:putative sensory transduction regulator
MRHIRSITLFLALSLSFPALAEVKSTLTSTEFETVLRQAGFDPIMAKSESNEPFATIATEEFVFTVAAKQCTDAACGLLLFFANFDLDREMTLTDYKAVNSFNDREFFGRAYVRGSQQQVGIDFILDLRGGLDTGYISQNAERFPAILQKFVDHFIRETGN